MNNLVKYIAILSLALLILPVVVTTTDATVSSTSYTLEINSTAGGNVTKPGEGTFNYTNGTEINLVAVHDEDHFFLNWSEGTGNITNASSANTTIEVKGNYSITANFMPLVNETWVNESFTNNGTHFDTIQKGIDAVKAGGTVNIHPGTYNEGSIEIIGKDEVTVQSVNKTNETIIEGNHSFGLTIFSNDFTLDGITIGNYSEVGIAIGETSGVTIRNNVVQNIEGIGEEPGMSVISINSTGLNVSNNSFTNNGVGVMLMNSTSLNNILENNNFENNLVDHAEMYSGYLDAKMGSLNSILEGVYLRIEFESSPDNTTKVTILEEDWTIHVPVTATENATITITNGTSITRTIGDNLNIFGLNASNTTQAGFNASIKFGLDYDLTFSSPVNISLFVGEELNDSTLNIFRQGEGGWTQDGLVNTNCTVSAGFCEIQTNQASEFAVTDNENKFNYSLTIDSTKGGSVTKPGEGTYLYNETTNETLETTVKNHYEFVEWTGDIENVENASSANMTIEVNGTQTITANFERIRYSLTIDSTTGGEVTTPGEDTYSRSGNVTLKAVASSDYEFDKWTGDTETIANTGSASTKIDMLGDYSITAEFTKTNSGEWVRPPTDDEEEDLEPIEQEAEVENKTATTKVTNVEEGQTIEITVPDTGDWNTTIEKIKFTAASSADEVSVTIKTLETQKPEDTPQAAEQVHHYLQINIEGIDSEDVEIYFKVPKTFLEQSNEDPENIVLRRYNNEEWEKLETTLEDDNDDYYRFKATLASFSYFAVTLDETPNIQVKSLEVTPKTAAIPFNINIEVQLENTGNAEGTYTVEVKLENRVIKTEEVTLQPEQSLTTTYTYLIDHEGNYTITVANLTKTVEALPETPEKSPWAYRILLIIIAAILILVGAVMAQKYYEEYKDRNIKLK